MVAKVCLDGLRHPYLRHTSSMPNPAGSRHWSRFTQWSLVRGLCQVESNSPSLGTVLASMAWTPSFPVSSATTAGMERGGRTRVLSRPWCGPSGGIRLVIQRITADDGLEPPVHYQMSWSAAGIGDTRRRGEVRVAVSRQGLAGRRFTGRRRHRVGSVGVCRYRPAGHSPGRTGCVSGRGHHRLGRHIEHGLRRQEVIT